MKGVSRKTKLERECDSTGAVCLYVCVEGLVSRVGGSNGLGFRV